ncbi:carbohydrate kinase family protein [Elongatibacter sediminis]|uniref:Carbohydrate kinase family protein n=1 Tax=Elongatibacter sediminis TaxID=3119006 RepID=A0AAW9RAK6_9GAMM
MSALICGSLAYDTIMVFPERFREHILPDKVHILNVSFLVPEMRREFGGCAGNIAYNLKLLGGEPYPMGAVGADFEPYREHLAKWGISDRYVRYLEDEFTPQAFITTDLDDNQITAFHPGAMAQSHLNHVADAEGITIGVVGPDGREAMIQHSHDFVEAGIPHLFDPGQGMILFNGNQLRNFISEANWLIVNDYEYEVLQERTGMPGHLIARQVEALIVTRGPDGSELITAYGHTDIEPTLADAVKDPTGCGDAYRAGILHALLNDMDLVTGCRIGSVMGAIKIAHQGPQNHTPSLDEIQDRFEAAYGYRF